MTFESWSASVLLLAAACTVSRAAPSVTSPDGTFELALPARWAGHYRIDSLATAERATARPGAIAVSYLPTDSSKHSEVLVVVAVYDSAAWVAVRHEEGPPPGDSVAAHAGRVYVVGLPQSNPFTPGTGDASRFETLQLRPPEVKALVRLSER